MLYDEYTFRVPRSLRKELAGSWCYGKSRFGVQPDGKTEDEKLLDHNLKSIERFLNKNIQIFIDSEYRDRKIDVKPSVDTIQVTVKEVEV